MTHQVIFTICFSVPALTWTTLSRMSWYFQQWRMVLCSATFISNLTGLLYAHGVMLSTNSINICCMCFGSCPSARCQCAFCNSPFCIEASPTQNHLYGLTWTDIQPDHVCCRPAWESYVAPKSRQTWGERAPEGIRNVLIWAARFLLLPAVTSLAVIVPSSVAWCANWCLQSVFLEHEVAAPRCSYRVMKQLFCATSVSHLPLHKWSVKPHQHVFR